MTDIKDLPPMWLREQAYLLRQKACAAISAPKDGLYGAGCRHVAAAYAEASELLEHAARDWVAKMELGQ